MKTKTNCLALTSLLVLLFALSTVTPGSPNNKTNFTLDDTTGVSSDGLGAYHQGQRGVGAQITTPAGDFLGTFYAGSTRSLKINYASPVDPLNAPFSGIHVVNATATGAWDAITVRDILTIPVGTTALRNGYLLVQRPYVDPEGVPHVATQNWNTSNLPGLFFSVTRTAKGQWIVQSQNILNGDETNLKFFHDTGTSWVFESAAAYHIPIRMTINQ